MEQSCKVCGGNHLTGACTQNKNKNQQENHPGPKDIRGAAYDWVAKSGLEPDEIVDKFLPRFEEYSQGISDNKRNLGFKKGYSNEDFRALCDIIKTHPDISPLLRAEIKKKPGRPTDKDLDDKIAQYTQIKERNTYDYEDIVEQLKHFANGVAVDAFEENIRDTYYAGWTAGQNGDFAKLLKKMGER